MSQPDETPVRTTVTPERPRIGWHPLDPVSLVAGLLAVAIALVSLLDVDLDVDGAVVVPVLLLVAGLLGLGALLRRRR